MRSSSLNYLFVSSATTNLVVATLVDGKVSYLYNEYSSSDTSSKIMPIIKEAFDKSNIKPRDIDCIFVVNGPGSFTGIRIGLTVCKTFAWSLGIKIVPISSLEMMVSGFDEKAISLIDARRGYVYAGGYDDKLDSFFDDRYVKIDDIHFGGKFVSYDGFDFTVEKPKIDILKIIKKHENDKGINVHMLNPMYLKLTEAEEKKLNDTKA